MRICVSKLFQIGGLLIRICPTNAVLPGRTVIFGQEWSESGKPLSF
jgi:hypothetical protein